MNLPIDPASLILATTTITAILLYLYEHNLRARTKAENEKQLEEYKQKAFEILHKSINESQEMLGDAQLEGVKIVADTKYEVSRLEKDYSEKLAELIRQSEKNITNSQGKLIVFMEGLQRRSKELEVSSQSAVEQRISRMFENLESKLGEFLVSTQEKTISSIELELKAARNLIDSYKDSQLKLVDENIIAMMEQTLNIVLAKKLSISDKLNLVYEALEKAKIEKFIV